MTKTARSPKLDKKEKFFDDARDNAQNLALMTYQKNPFNAFVLTLRSKVELNWTHAILPVIARFVQFSKIAKKLNIDLCQFFSQRKDALSLFKIMK